MPVWINQFNYYGFLALLSLFSLIVVKPAYVA